MEHGAPSAGQYQRSTSVRLVLVLSLDECEAFTVTAIVTES